MKEMTRVITLQVTEIETMTDEDAEMLQKFKPDAIQNLKDDMNNFFCNPDDLIVTVQDFERDMW